MAEPPEAAREQQARVPELVLTGPWTPPGRLARELWASREVGLTLARKNFFVQYRRTVLGLLWAVGLPMIQAAVLAAVFSRVAQFAVPHFPVYVLSGMIAWTYFSSSLGAGSTAIVDSSGLASKIYFPRATLPLSVCGSNAYSLLISVVVLVLFAAGFGVYPGWHSLLLVPASLLLIALVSGLTLTLSVAHVYLRDTRYLISAAMLGWMWVTPVVYPLTQVHHALRAVVDINPVSGIVEMFHAAVYVSPVDRWSVVSTVLWICAFATSGTLLHARFDRVVADLL